MSNRVQEIFIAFRKKLQQEPSATLVLQKWCDSYSQLTPTPILAIQDKSRHKIASKIIRQQLQVSQHERICHRYVYLTYQGYTLSEADNWYVPSRLSSEINLKLEQTHTPFGRAISEMNFTRHILSDETYLNDGITINNTVPGILPDYILQHQAILLANALPLSFVIENYRKEVILLALK